LLTGPSLRRKGSWPYLSDRLWRIGVPFLIALPFLSPLAYYAAHGATVPDTSIAAFWARCTALPCWPSGPQWFLWQLCALSAMAAAAAAWAPHWLPRPARVSQQTHGHTRA